jgi:hypothetical protein
MQEHLLSIYFRMKDGCIDGHKYVTKTQMLEHLMVEVMVDTGPR